MKNLVRLSTAWLIVIGCQLSAIAAPTHRAIAKADETKRYTAGLSLHGSTWGATEFRMKLTLAGQTVTSDINLNEWMHVQASDLKPGVYTATATLLGLDNYNYSKELTTNPSGNVFDSQSLQVYSTNGLIKLISVGNVSPPPGYMAVGGATTSIVWGWGSNYQEEMPQTQNWLAHHTINHIGDTCKIVFYVGPYNSPFSVKKFLQANSKQASSKSNDGCSIKPLTPITDSVALRFERGDNIDIDHLTPQMQASLTMFRQKIDQAGGHMVLTSAYRPPAYQNHLRDVWDKWQLLKNNHKPGCQKLRSQVKSEFLKHGLKNQRPASAAGPHTQGLAIDLGMTRMGLSREKILEIAKECGLYLRKDLPNDPFHFQHL